MSSSVVANHHVQEPLTKNVQSNQNVSMTNQSSMTVNQSTVTNQNVNVPSQGVVNSGSSNLHRVQGQSTATNQSSNIDIIKLKAIGENFSREIHFRVRTTTKLGKLKKSYCKRVRIPMMCLQFNFKGMEISNLDTPKKLNMSNGDIIDIYKDDMDVAVTSLQFLLDGMKVDHGPPEEEFLKIRVVGQNFNEEREIHFRVKTNTEMIKLKMSFSKRVGIPLSCLRFLFEGRRINDNDTPLSLDMVDEDVIEVIRSQNPNGKLLSCPFR